MKYGHGGDIYTYSGMQDFSVNINPFGPPESVIQAAKKGVEASAAYPDSRCGELRRKLAGMQGLPENYYLFGNGAAELIYTLVLADKPGKALLPVPSFSEYEQALHTVGSEIKYYKTKEDSFFTVDNNFLDELTDDIDMVFLCSPANPSGHLTDQKLLEHTAEVCEQKGIRLVLDECFISFLEEPEKHTLIRETERFRSLFVVRAFTKIYAVPGLRLGYAVTSDADLVKKIGSSRQPWSVSIPAQEAGKAALGETEYVSISAGKIRIERRYLESEFRSVGIKYISSDANFILLETKKDLFNELKTRGILIRDCSNYRGLGPGWYRVAVCTHEKNVRLIRALKEIFRETEELR